MVARHFSKTSLKFVAALAVATALSACAGSPLRAALDDLADKVGLADVPPAESPAPAQPASVAVSAIDPLTAPPPAASAPTVAGPMLVPAPAQSTDGSQRVPLGAFAAATPTSVPPASASPASASPASALAAKPPMPITQPAAPPAMSVPAAVMLAPAPTEMQMAAKKTAPVLRAPIGRPANMTMDVPLIRGESTAATPPAATSPPETVIISSETARPVIQAREFVPASVIPGQIPIIPRRGDIPMTAAEKNVVQRFETLRRLQDESLIT